MQTEGPKVRRTDRNGEGNYRFSKFCERACKPMLMLNGKSSCFHSVEYEAQILTTTRRQRYHFLKRNFVSNFD
jgi:hypothetical protein